MTYNSDYTDVDELVKKAWDSSINNPKNGLSICRKAYKACYDINYKSGMATSLLSEGWCLIFSSDYKNALDTLTKSLELFEELNDKEGKHKSLSAIGVLYKDLNQYEKALDHFSQSLYISKEIDNSERLVTSLINIATLHLAAGKKDTALEQLLQAESLLKTSKNYEQLCVCFINMGTIYKDQKKYTKALEKYDKSLKFAKIANYKIYASSCLNNIGKIHMLTGNMGMSESFHKQSLRISEEIGNNTGVVNAFTDLAELYFKRNQLEESADYHKKALKISEKSNLKLFERENCLGLSEVYKKQRKYKKALEFFQRHHNIKNELINEEVKIKLKNISIQNEIEQTKKEAEIYRLQNIELKKSYDRISIINQIGQKITASLDMKIIMKTIYDNINLLLSADLFGIIIYEREKRELEYKFLLENGKELSPYKIPLSSKTSMAAWVIRNGKEILINNVKKEYKSYVKELSSSWETEKRLINSLIYTPLKIGNKITGLITVQSYTGNTYTTQHLEILQAIASYSAIALENARVNERVNELNRIILNEKKELEYTYSKIDDLANHDSLTGLPNRRLFNELMKKELNRASRQNNKVALFFIDLDNFKPVNDTIGHDGGDIILKTTASRFLSALRNIDSVARVGGDEFAAIISNVVNIKDVRVVAKKMIASLDSPIPAKNQMFTLGSSVGISIYPDDDDTIEKLMTKADIAMYRVKKSSKNSFIFYNDKFNAMS